MKFDQETDGSGQKHQQSFFVRTLGEVIKKLHATEDGTIFNEQNFMNCVSKIVKLVSLTLQREDIRAKFLDEMKKYVLGDLMA